MGGKRLPLARALATGLAANLVALAAGLVTSVVTARGLDPADRGTLIAVILWGGLVSMVSIAGTDDAIVFVSKGRSALAKALVFRLRRRQLILAIAASVVQAIVLYFAIDDIRMWLVGTFLSLLVVNANLVNQMLFSVLRTEGRLRTWALLQTVPPVVNLSALLALWVFGALNFTSAIVAWAASSVLTALIAMPATRPWSTMREIDGNAREIYAAKSKSYGWGVLQGVLPQQTNVRTPQLALGFLGDHAVLGVYAVAVSVTTLIQSASQMIDQVLFPRLVSGVTKEIKPFTAVLVSTAVGVALSTPVFVLAPWLIETIYGSAYLGAVGPMRVLLIAGIAAVSIGAMTAIAKSGGNAHLVRNAHVVGLLVTVGIIACLLGTFGAGAAAIAGSGSAVCVMVVLFIGLTRKRRS